MKIGILTFHRAINAGAVLQAYAMQETLKIFGHESFVIDYKPEYVTNAYKPLRSISILHPRGTFYEIWSAAFRDRRIKRYEEFLRNNFRLLPLDQASACDLFILGSDQIWNSSITGGRLDPVFFNQNLNIKAPIAIAYAASTMSTDRLTEKDKRLLSSYLPKLDAIGVREKALSDHILKDFGIKADLVLDPTLIAPKSIFDRLITEKAPADEYLCFYEVWHNEYVENKARQLAKEKGLEFLGLCGADIRFPRKDIKQVYSPDEFVSLIAGASHVVTSSFHGTALSLIFKKQFNVICEEPHQAVRMQELLALINRQDLFSYKMEPTSNRPIDYKEVNNILDNYRKRSLRFLNENINRYTGI